MIAIADAQQYASREVLAENGIASRVHAKDASLYGFDAAAQECCEHFMGWADLASNPPVPLAQVKDLARTCFDRGFEAAILIAQGGSSVAAMTIARYHTVGDGMRFFALDSDSPVRLREVLEQVDLMKTLFIVSSKSGGTIEIRSLLAAVRAAFAEALPDENIANHLVAITDPGSPLQGVAESEGWVGILPGEPTVGGRYSALSVFGLLPAALMGVDIDAFVAHALEAERLCSADSIDNPAIGLAAFMYDNYQAGRDKVVLLAPTLGRVLGLWVEQLVSESLGKNGVGILPNIEIDPALLASDPGDREIVIYRTSCDSPDELADFEAALALVDSAIPGAQCRIDSVEELAGHFVMWEYAVAMCGYLMQVCPFDQPDVQQAKTNVLHVLKEGIPASDFTQDGLGGLPIGTVAARVAPCLGECTTVYDAMRALFASIEPGDYFCTNAFLPYTGEERRWALEQIRHDVARRKGVASCLEIGPRYLHSTGQLYKGGPNKGVFLVVSADEEKDMPIENEAAASLAELAKAQATGDALTLMERGRRVVHIHLPNNAPVTLRALANEVSRALHP